MKIALKNVSKTFGGLKAVDDVSFEAGDGECFFLLGPSGSKCEYKGCFFLLGPPGIEGEYKRCGMICYMTWNI